MRDEYFRQKFTRQPGPLNDGSLMPFGVHKDKMMLAVPLAWLRWFVRECEILTAGPGKGGQNPWWPHLRDYLATRASDKVCVRSEERDARR